MTSLAFKWRGVCLVDSRKTRRYTSDPSGKGLLRHLTLAMAAASSREREIRPNHETPTRERCGPYVQSGTRASNFFPKGLRNRTKRSAHPHGAHSVQQAPQTLWRNVLRPLGTSISVRLGATANQCHRVRERTSAVVLTLMLGFKMWFIWVMGTPIADWPGNGVANVTVALSTFLTNHCSKLGREVPRGQKAEGPSVRFCCRCNTWCLKSS